MTFYRICKYLFICHLLVGAAFYWGADFILNLFLSESISKQTQNLGFGQSQRRRFDPIEAASYPGDGSDAEGFKDEDADTGKNQALGLFGYKKSSTAILFENIMIRENGIYTLLGSKPITEFPIDSPCENIPQNDDDLKEWYNDLIDDLKAFGDTTFPTFDEYKKEKENVRQLKHLYRIRLWDEWKNSGYEIQNPQFKLLEWKHCLGDEKTGFLVNIPATQELLQSHYQSFKERVGVDFDIPEIINELESEDSIFWHNAFSNHYLSGLLFGFGEKEASQFDKYHDVSAADDLVLRRGSMSVAGFDAELEKHLLLGEKLKLEDLGIPCFAVFSTQSESVDAFLKERSQILRQLKGKNLEAFLIDYLKITSTDTNLE